MATYKWKPGHGVPGVEAEDARNEIIDNCMIDGIIDHELMVKRATDDDNILHGGFTWDDEKAAHKCRINEAKHIERGIMKVVNGELTREFEAISVRVEMADPEDNSRVIRKTEHHHQTIESIMSDPMRGMKIIEEQEVRVRQAKTKLNRLYELADDYGYRPLVQPPKKAA